MHEEQLNAEYFFPLQKLNNFRLREVEHTGYPTTHFCIVVYTGIFKNLHVNKPINTEVLMSR
jgi:hypothetical protein